MIWSLLGVRELVFEFVCRDTWSQSMAMCFQYALQHAIIDKSIWTVYSLLDKHPQREQLKECVLDIRPLLWIWNEHVKQLLLTLVRRGWTHSRRTTSPSVRAIVRKTTSLSEIHWVQDNFPFLFHDFDEQKNVWDWILHNAVQFENIELYHQITSRYEYDPHDRTLIRLMVTSKLLELVELIYPSLDPDEKQQLLNLNVRTETRHIVEWIVENETETPCVVLRWQERWSSMYIDEFLSESERECYYSLKHYQHIDNPSRHCLLHYLWIQCDKNRLDNIVWILKEHEIVLTDEEQDTLLNHTISRGNVNIVKFWMNRRFTDFHNDDEKLSTYFWRAALYEHLDILQWMITQFTPLFCPMDFEMMLIVQKKTTVTRIIEWMKEQFGWDATNQENIEFPECAHVSVTLKMQTEDLRNYMFTLAKDGNIERLDFFLTHRPDAYHKGMRSIAQHYQHVDIVRRLDQHKMNE